MEKLLQILVALFAVGAMLSLARIASGLYEFRTGRLVRHPFRRKLPATPEDTRKNGLVHMLDDLGALLFNFIVVSSLLLQQARPDPVLTVGYIAAGAAGIAATFLSMFLAHHLRGEVRYVKRQKPASVPSAQA